MAKVKLQPSQIHALANLRDAYISYYRDSDKVSLSQLDYKLVIAAKEVLDSFLIFLL
jgi:hypothetical protein